MPDNKTRDPTDAEIEAEMLHLVRAGDMEIVDTKPDGTHRFRVTEQGRRRVEQMIKGNVHGKQQ